MAGKTRGRGGLRDRLLVKPGSTVNLADVDPTLVDETSADEALNTLVPDSPRAPYDMKDAIRRVVDDGEFFEVFPLWAGNILIGFARLDGRSIGIVC